MDDELEPFRAEPEDDGGRERSMIERDFLLFSVDGALFGVHTDDVDSVIAWRAPAPLPGGAPRIVGVVQDRGRVITVCDPRGAAASAAARIIVCTTSHGLLGLLAEETRSVSPISLEADPAHGSILDTPQGALTYVEPQALAEEVMGRTD